ncbi:MAG: prolyl-tRNA synthetase associated domain-containing protein [Oscillospiraceae bacterium]|nr:prolyl-tRNA synthetase associated domain-containing protein [Oscillospiraceae bacterium]
MDCDTPKGEIRMNIDPVLHPCRPESERLEKEMKCYDLLDLLGIPYLRADHDHADTIDLCREIEKILGCQICKNLLLTNRQMTSFYLLMMPGDKPFRTKDLSKQIQSARLSFASGEQMEQLLGISPGSLTVLGLMNDTEGKVKLLIDSDLIPLEYIGCHPCVNSSTLKLKMTDVIEFLLPAMHHDITFVELPRS